MGVAHSSFQCPFTPLSRSCEFDGRRTGEKRARGVPEHAQLKGVNRPVAAVGVAWRPPGYRRKSSPKGLLLEMGRNNTLPPHATFPLPFWLPGRPAAIVGSLGCVSISRTLTQRRARRAHDPRTVSISNLLSNGLK